MYLAVADAGCADAHPLAAALDQRMNRLEVQIPAALGHIVGVADTVPELRPAAADLTNFCHRYTLPLSQAEPVNPQYSMRGAGQGMP